jgi:hypothetical protein
MKNYVKSTLKPKAEDQPDKQGPSHDNNDGTGAVFPGEDGAVHMIFGGSPVRPSRQREKLIRHEVMHADVVTPSYLKGSRQYGLEGGWVNRTAHKFKLFLQKDCEAPEPPNEAAFENKLRTSGSC